MLPLQSGGLSPTTALLALVVALLFAVALLLVRLWFSVRSLGSRDADVEVDSDVLTAAVSRTFTDLEFVEKVDRIEDHAGRMRELHSDIDGMLRDPRKRGAFGEEQLDVLLSDHLPPEMYGLRERVVDGKTPDAHIRTSSGLVCVDSKFPLDNYERAVGTDDEAEAARYRDAFAGDVESQLAKIADDYVRPAAGTTDFAFAFVPSESVYYHLVTEEYDMLREFTREGVQVVSPLTFGHKLELIKADVQARRLSEEAEAVADQLDSLREAFAAVEDEWGVLQTHVRNAANKAEDVDREYRRLRGEFDRIDEPTLAAGDGVATDGRGSTEGRDGTDGRGAADGEGT
ncbi:DNA recombination protein RmuC [Halorarum salinum]|uniref:DNA recombination protein RmuC n=1 Tax=Halorarum salinum TaxID=2743089 RepID=A0A7D5L8Y3_9EURY|nr:DNA recombination protein RmuC [Halobaculum salinum]QLG60832.1 DNA recombination protein RmuC [Halobaculum salinum]